MKARLLVAAGLLLMPSLSLAQISGSAHDFRASAWSDNEICKPCHTPHNAKTTISVAPLWNHTLTTATYSVYGGLDMEQTPGDPKGGISGLCLSCHDGTVALDSFGTTPTTTEFITGPANFGTDLKDDHPIAIVYATSAGADTEIRAANPTITSWLAAGSVECSSCHDVHNGGSGPSLLRISNTNSDLCLTCHAK